MSYSAVTLAGLPRCAGRPRAAACSRRPSGAALPRSTPDRLRIGPGRAAQARGLPHPRLIRLTLAGALQDARHIGQQVTSAARKLAQRRHRAGFLVLGELPPLRLVLRLTVKLRDEDPVGLRALIDHTF
jgi:hypothetical protein